MVNGLAFVDHFIINGDIIGNRLSAFPFDKPVELFKMRRRNLFGVFADFYFGDNIAVLVLNGGKLVNASENQESSWR